MAWPYDARHYDFAADLWVPSATLNEMEDKIVDLFSDHELITLTANTGWVSGTSEPGWAMNMTNPERGWQCIGLEDLYLSMTVRQSMVIKSITAKYYNAHLTDPLKPPISLYAIDPKLSNDTTAPVLGSAIADFTGVSTIAAGAWGVRTVGSLSLTLAAGRRWMFIVASATTDDYLAALSMTVQPLTAT